MSVQVLAPTSWHFAQAAIPLTEAEWTPCTQFPTEIHLELRAANRIPDWNKGRTEHDVQWVATKSWAFKAELKVDESMKKGLNKAELDFEGLDTFAEVHLNGKEILRAENHFLTHTVVVSLDDLMPTNELLIIFRPPQPVAQAVAAKYGPFRGGSCNLGNRARMGIRKSQYHFRWDWGPELMCMGPDRPIHLRMWKERLGEVRTAARVDEGLRRSLRVDVDVEGAGTVGGKWRVVLKGGDEQVIRQEETSGPVEWELGEEVWLWWPVGHGAQLRYTVTVELLGEDGSILDTLNRKIGFRRSKLVQEPVDGQEGTTFLFEINNKRIFMGGNNWIPIDMVLPSGTRERYRRWLELMVKGNQNMIRVWGGGVFEPDVFYGLCDELGILVWQDFMFACGVYPIFPSFLESVKAESECNVRRLRHHPSIVLFCGNNEDYQQILQWDFDKKGDPLPARVIYEKMLPEIVGRLTDPEIDYHRGSPYGGKDWDTTDPTVGDIHQWDVWAGKGSFYQDYDVMGGRFVSEFGMPSFPDMRTVEYWLDGDHTQAKPQSKLMQQHNKAGSHERRFAIYMNENFSMTSDLETYAYLTRLMQAEAVGWAYTAWRREWRGKGKEYLNDCWPVTSWALVDYFFRPKPAFFAIARSLEPIALGIRRTVIKNRENDRPRQFYEYGAFQSRVVTVEVWGVNSGSETRVTLQVSAVDLNSDWRIDMPENEVVLSENASSELWSGPCLQPSKEKASDQAAPSGTVVLLAKLVDQQGRVLARFSDWPQPYKLLDLPDPGIKVEVGDGEVVVSAAKPAKGVWLSVEGDDEGVEFDDNSLDLFPGEKQRVKVKGLKGRKVTVAYLGKEKATAV